MNYKERLNLVERKGELKMRGRSLRRRDHVQGKRKAKRKRKACMQYGVKGERACIWEDMYFESYLTLTNLDIFLPSGVVYLLQEYDDVFPDEIPHRLPLIKGY